MMENAKKKATVNCESNTAGKKPVISVIMPAYQAGQYLAQAVCSVLGQTCKEPLELLVIDDASTDNTCAVMEQFAKDARVRYVRRKSNHGASAARNLGISMARGRYLAFLDADDWWAPDKLELQMECFANTGAVLCCTARELMNPDGTASGRVIQTPETITFPMLLRTNVIPFGSVVVQADAAREFAFAGDRYHEDYLFLLHLLNKYKMAAGINVPALKCRLSVGGKSRNKLKSARMQYRSYRYFGFGRLRAFYYMVFYTANGLRKYLG